VLVERFAAYHRQSYGGCKPGIGDVLIGAAASMAEYNGVSKAAHIRDKLGEMIHLVETGAPLFLKLLLVIPLYQSL